MDEIMNGEPSPCEKDHLEVDRSISSKACSLDAIDPFGTSQINSATIYTDFDIQMSLLSENQLAKLIIKSSTRSTKSGRRMPSSFTTSCIAEP